MNNSRTEQPIKAYDLNAQKYEAKFSNYPTYRDKIRDFHNKHIPPGATLLDLGCGPGQNIRAILELDRSIRATGIDLSREFISIASRQNPAAKFLQADIRKLSAESRYDVILASFCIVHLKRAETENLLSSIAESLADNGKLYLSFMQGTGSGFETTSFSDQEIFFNYYQFPDIAQLLKKTVCRCWKNRPRTILSLTARPPRMYLCMQGNAAVKKNTDSYWKAAREALLHRWIRNTSKI